MDARYDNEELFQVDENVLEHLLKIEAEAAALVDDAQAEADKRVAEGEKQNRARYEQIYSKEAAGLEESCQKAIALVREDYAEQLEAYRGSLTSIAADQGRFNALLEELLSGGR
jgi:F0F1-type ATP synthase membrane subunit b/b'